MSCCSCVATKVELFPRFRNPYDTTEILQVLCFSMRQVGRDGMGGGFVMLQSNTNMINTGFEMCSKL